MNHKTKYIATFLTGVAVGVAASYTYFKNKYEQLVQEEIDSVKEAFARQQEEESEEVNEIKEYRRQIREAGYVNYHNMSSTIIETDDEEVEPIMDKPYVIPPEEFGMKDDYELVSLTYYADAILADDQDMKIEDVENMVGFESLGTFGTYEDDCVHVRNDTQKTDYEILRALRDYSDVIKEKPYLMED